jgi:hypothetical protein
MLPDKAAAFLDCLGHHADPSLNCTYDSQNEGSEHKCPNNHFEHRFFCRGYSQLSHA